MGKKKKKGGKGGKRGPSGPPPPSSSHDAILERHKKERKAISRQCAKLEQQIILSTNDDEKEQLRQRMVDIQDELQKRHDLELSAADKEAADFDDEDDDALFVAISKRAEEDRAAAEQEDVSAEPSTVTEEDGGVEWKLQGERKKSKQQLRKERRLQRERELQEESERKAASVEDKRLVENEQLQRILLPLSLRFIEVPADGDCLYHSLGRQLEHGNSVQTLREQAANFMRSNREDFEPFIDGDFDEYCHELTSTKCWGGQIEIRALSMALNNAIEVYTAFAPMQSMGKGREDAAPLRLAFHRHYYALGQHYNSVEPL